MLEQHTLDQLRGLRLDGMIAAVDVASAPSDPLLNGPARPGQGLDQATIDQSF